MAEFCNVTLRGLPEMVRAVTVGSSLRIYVWITDADLLAVEPDAVTLRVQSPAEDAAEQVWTLPAGETPGEGELTPTTPGNWYADVTLDAAGEWKVRAEASESHADADERRFVVPPPEFPTAP